MKKQTLTYAAVLFIVALMILPVIILFLNSLMPIQKMNDAYVSGGSGKIYIVPLPAQMDQYTHILLDNREYLSAFWRSLLFSITASLLQLGVSFLSGYVLGKVRFRGSGLIMFLYILAMLMPLQVTLVPQYIIMNKLHLINTSAALYLPLIFAPFGTFMMRQFMIHFPNELTEYLRLEGGGTAILLSKVIAPFLSTGMCVLFLLSFAENWNIVEQGMVLISDPHKYPLSLLINNSQLIPLKDVFAASVVSLIPVFTLLAIFKESLVKGIQYLGEIT